MKNSIQLNIGTATLDGQTLTIPEIATSLRRAGLVLTSARIVTGQWEGKEEQTIACECIPALPICHAECRLAIASAIGKLARELRQTCIALAWPDGSGELCPPVSGQVFDPSRFHPASASASVPACDCLSNVINACNHLAQVAEDNGDIAAVTKYLRADHILQSNADYLRAVIYPAPIPDRKFFESIAFDLKAVREHAENIKSSQACIKQEIDSLWERIYPLAVEPARTPEITSGW